MIVQEKAIPRISGLRPVPVLGAKAGLFRFFGDPIGCLTKLYRVYGLLGSITDGESSLVCAFGAEFNQQVLSDQRLFNNWAELPVKLPPDSAPMHLNNGLTAMTTYIAVIAGC